MCVTSPLRTIQIFDWRLDVSKECCRSAHHPQNLKKKKTKHNYYVRNSNSLCYPDPATVALSCLMMNFHTSSSSSPFVINILSLSLSRLIYKPADAAAADRVRFNVSNQTEIAPCSWTFLMFFSSSRAWYYYYQRQILLIKKKLSNFENRVIKTYL